MKPWIKILSVGIIVLVLVFAAIHIFLLLEGKAVIIKQLETLTHKKVTISSFGIVPPLNLQIQNLVIENLARADSVSISPSILGFLTGSVAFNNIRIIKPEVTYERALPQVAESSAAASTATAGKKRPLRLIFKRLKIQDGKLNFIDRTVGEGGIRVTVKDINLSLNNLYALPRSVITNFELKAKIPWQEEAEEGSIEVEGWLNLFKRNMEATLKIKDIDGVYLYPYYSNWVDLEKARIAKAKLNFTSYLHGLNNNLTADCHLELTDIVRKPRSSEEPEERAEKIADAVLGIFRALNQGKIVLDFTIRTRMDRPEFGLGNIKTAFEEKLAQGKTNGFKVGDVLKMPANILESTVTSATDLTKAVISGTFSVGKELKKAVEDIFRKEKKEN